MGPGGGQSAGLFGGLIKKFTGSNRQTAGMSMTPMGGNGPLELRREMYSDDFSFCRSFNGLNIVITGATGTIGSILVDTLLKNS